MTIVQARKEKGMSRRELSEWLEIPYRTLTNWENGVRPCPPYIEKLIVKEILRNKTSKKEMEGMKIVGYENENIVIAKIDGVWLEDKDYTLKEGYRPQGSGILLKDGYFISNTAGETYSKAFKYIAKGIVFEETKELKALKSAKTAEAFVDVARRNKMDIEVRISKARKAVILTANINIKDFYTASKIGLENKEYYDDIYEHYTKESYDPVHYVMDKNLPRDVVKHILFFEEKPFEGNTVEQVVAYEKGLN